MPGNEGGVVIIGAGVAGLSLAYHLKLPYHVYERETRVGGLCRSEEIAGCTFDYAPRLLLPGSQYAAEVSHQLMDENWQSLLFSDWNYHHDPYRFYTRLPIQEHLYGLPATEILRCLTGLVEAARSFDERQIHESANYRDWLYACIGRPIADLAIIPQEKKKWKTNPAEMDFRWALRRVSRPDLETALRGATHDIPQARRFGYPLRGGFAALMEAFAAHLNHLNLGVSLQALDPRRGIAYFDDGSARSYRALAATLPLPLLVSMLDDAPDGVREAAEGLEHVSLLCVCMVIKRDVVSDKHSIYVHDPGLIFHRVSFLSNLSPYMVPSGFSSLVAEVTYIDQPPMDDTALFQCVRADLIAMGILQPDDRIVDRRVLHLPYAYPRPVLGWMDKARHIRAYLERLGIYAHGRFGEWEYLNVHHIIPRSRNLARLLEERHG
jgi:protoporphyrinogen oxidase